MSKLRKKLKKAAMIGATLLAAKTLKGKAGPVGDKVAKARAAMTSDVAMKGKPIGKVLAKATAPSGITKIKASSLPAKRNLKSIFVGDDGSITKGLEKFSSKDVFSKTMKSRRGENSLKDFLNKVILGPKTQIGGGKSKVVKARGGGMAMGGMKPTKLY